MRNPVALIRQIQLTIKDIKKTVKGDNSKKTILRKLNELSNEVEEMYEGILKDGTLIL